MKKFTTKVLPLLLVLLLPALALAADVVPGLANDPAPAAVDVAEPAEDNEASEDIAAEEEVEYKWTMQRMWGKKVVVEEADKTWTMKKMWAPEEEVVEVEDGEDDEAIEGEEEEAVVDGNTMNRLWSKPAEEKTAASWSLNSLWGSGEEVPEVEEPIEEELEAE